ncbi:DUF72 domain-containing protein, partial [Novosphingobium sp. TCA1]|uniref:DUF72 domain-containing protein n=1 Tax=Novosphingobium sp. TCA1 TaxID=2682474 RepID=UPI001356E9A8
VDTSFTLRHSTEQVPGISRLPFVYARLQNARSEIEQGYPDAELDHWAARAAAWSKSGRDVSLFFINGAKERAPAAAMALIGKL